MGVLVLLALVGWGVAELKAKALPYEQDEQEKDVERRAAEALQRDGYTELGIADVVRTISTKGFSAV